MDVDLIISKLSQGGYAFKERGLSNEEIVQLKNQAKDSRGRYGVNAPIGPNVFSFMEKKGDIVFQLQEFKDSELDAIIVWYSMKSSRKYIIINSEKPLINQIFAAAHELYHYSYTFKGNSNKSIVCNFSKDEKEEVKANRFAAEFLLPEEALKDELDYYLHYTGVPFTELSYEKQIVFCINLVMKYSIPLKAVIYRLSEEGVSNVDYLLGNYAEVKVLIGKLAERMGQLKELYSNDNMYITESLYDLVPYLYKRGRLDDSAVDEIISDFSLDGTDIWGALID